MEEYTLMVDRPDNAEEVDVQSNGHEQIGDAERRSRRKQEWGSQLDKWLINQAQKQTVCELLVSYVWPGVTRDGNIVQCKLLRVDRDAVQVLVDSVDIWLSKDYIIGYKRVGKRTIEKQGE